MTNSGYSGSKIICFLKRVFLSPVIFNPITIAVIDYKIDPFLIAYFLLVGGFNNEVWDGLVLTVDVIYGEDILYLTSAYHIIE